MAATAIHQAPGVVDTVLYADKQLVFVRWYEFGQSNHFRASLDAQMAAVKARRARFVVVDAVNATGVPLPADQSYLVETVFPTFEAAGLEAIITIVPKSALTKLGAKRWQQAGSQFSFAMYEVGSLDDAKQLIADQYAQAV